MLLGPAMTLATVSQHSDYWDSSRYMNATWGAIVRNEPYKKNEDEFIPSTLTTRVVVAEASDQEAVKWVAGGSSWEI